MPISSISPKKYPMPGALTLVFSAEDVVGLGRGFCAAWEKTREKYPFCGWNIGNSHVIHLEKTWKKNEQFGNSLHNYQCFCFFLAHWGSHQYSDVSFASHWYGLPQQFHPITSVKQPRLLIVRPHTAAFLSRHGFLPGTASPTSKASLEGLVFRYLAVIDLMPVAAMCCVYSKYDYKPSNSSAFYFRQTI